jgi:hypothetical protein
MPRPISSLDLADARRIIAAGWDACLNSIKRPAAQKKIKALFEQGFHQPGDAEDRLGFYVGQLGR